MLCAGKVLSAGQSSSSQRGELSEKAKMRKSSNLVGHIVVIYAFHFYEVIAESIYASAILIL